MRKGVVPLRFLVPFAVGMGLAVVAIAANWGDWVVAIFLVTYGVLCVELLLIRQGEWK